MFHRLGAGHVDDGRARGKHHARTQHRLFAHANALDHHAPRPDERAVFDHDGLSLHRLEDAAETHSAGQVHVLPDLRT